jgi:hypothetical protein
VIDIPFDPEDPPIEPPPSVQQPLLWSVSRRVYGDHDAPDDQGGPMVPQCRLCGEPWPCRARRVAEHGLLAACRAPIDSAGPASYLDRFLADGGPERRRSPTNRGPFEGG